MQEFGIAAACACACSAVKETQRTQSLPRKAILLRIVANDREDNEVHEAEHRDDREQRTLLAARGAAIEERNEREERRRHAEGHHAETFTFESEHVAGQQLQRVEHREEIPFGADA